MSKHFVFKMIKVIVILLALTLNSCLLIKGKGLDFEIKNNSKSTITDVKFYTSEKLQIKEFYKIEPDKSESDFLSMKKNETDGNFILEFTRANGKKEKIGSGYYTNGGPLNHWVEFEIKPDTTYVRYSETDIY